MKTKIYNIIKRDKIFLLLLLSLFIYYCFKFVNQKYFGLEGGAVLHYIVGLRNGWLRGEIYPLWFDNMCLGAPLWQHGFIIPFILPAVCFFLDPIVSSKLFNLIFFIFSAYTMYLYVYSHIKNRFISALSGLIFIFVPQRLWENFTWGFYTPQLHYFLIPLLLLSMEKMFQEKKYYFYAVILLGLILSTYSNFLYIMVLFMVLVVLYHLYSELSDMQKRSLWFISLFILFFMGKIRFSISVWLAIASIFYFYRFIKGEAKFRFIKSIFVLLFGLGLTAIFWVPLIFLGPYKDFFGFNIIEQLTNQVNVGDSWKNASLMVENSTRVNIFIPILAFSVVFTRGWKNSVVRFYSLILVITMLLNLKFQPLWEFFNNHIPFFYTLRYPERLVNFFGIIFYPLMTAYSLEGFYSFFKSSSEKLKEQFLLYYSIKTLKVISFIFIGFIICYIFYINQKLSFSDLVAFSKPQPKIPMNLLTEKDKRIAIFRNEPVWVMDNWMHDAMWTPFIYTNGMKSLHGDDPSYRDFVMYLPHDGPGKIIAMGMMNTKYIMTKLKIPDSDINDLNLIVVPSKSSDFYIYENKKCLPRVLLTKGSTVDMISIQGWATDWVKQIPFDRVSFIGPLKEGNEELTGISFKHIKHIKPLKILMNDNVPIFEVPPKRKQIERNKFIPESAFTKYPLENIKYNTVFPIKGTIEIIKETDNNLELKTNTLEDSILVYTKANWPGWQAKIDGIKQDLFNANGMMIGLFVPSGSHNIEIKYNYPDFFITGIKITFITLLIFLLIWIKAHRGPDKVS